MQRDWHLSPGSPPPAWANQGLSISRRLYFAESIRTQVEPLLRLWMISVRDKQKTIIASQAGVVPFGLSMNPDGRRLVLSSGKFATPSLYLLQIRPVQSPLG
jgi:hypothetical protein